MEKVEKIVKDLLYFVIMMVKLDDVDGMVLGVVYIIGDLLRLGL